MATDEELENGARVIVRIEDDLEKVLRAYEAQAVPPEISLVALIKAVHRRALSQEIPFDRILLALNNL